MFKHCGCLLPKRGCVKRGKLAQHFMMDVPSKKEEIQERLKKETEKKQQKIVQDYANKKGLVLDPEEFTPLRNTAKPGTGRFDKYPNIVRLQIPTVMKYESPSGATYVVVHGLEKIAETLMTTTEENELQKKQHERVESGMKYREELKAKGKQLPLSWKKRMKFTEKEEELMKVIKTKNNIMENIPKDPEGNLCLHEHLLISISDIVGIIGVARNSIMKQIGCQKVLYIESLTNNTNKVITQGFTFGL